MKKMSAVVLLACACLSAQQEPYLYHWGLGGRPEGMVHARLLQHGGPTAEQKRIAEALMVERCKKNDWAQGDHWVRSEGLVEVYTHDYSGPRLYYWAFECGSVWEDLLVDGGTR